MANAVATCSDLVIAAAGTSTRWVESVLETQDAVLLGITSPAVLDAGTYSIQISFDGTTSAGTLNNLTADVAVPAASKHVQYQNIVAPYWRIAGPAAAATRTFKLTKLWNPY